jgi:hypothetical protein
MITKKGIFVYKEDSTNRRYRIYYIEDFKTNNEQTKLVANIPDIYKFNLAKQLCDILNSKEKLLNLDI